MVHHYKTYFHHCTFFASLHVKTSPAVHMYPCMKYEHVYASMYDIVCVCMHNVRTYVSMNVTAYIVHFLCTNVCKYRYDDPFNSAKHMLLTCAVYKYCIVPQCISKM